MQVIKWFHNWANHFKQTNKLWFQIIQNESNWNDVYYTTYYYMTKLLDADWLRGVQLFR